MSENRLSVDCAYSETCSSIRATDDTSFKLMGLVPLISGATLLTLFMKDTVSPELAPLLVALALFAALITLGLFRWELRNIQRCRWMLNRAKTLEDEAFGSKGLPEEPNAPLRIGKTEAEKGIYSITILSWLIMPVVLIDSLREFKDLFQMYAGTAAFITLFTAISVFRSIKQ